MMTSAFCASSLLFATACGAQGIEQDVAGGQEVLLVQQPWEDLVVENEIVRQVLEENGYEVTVQEVSVPIGAQALADGSVDAYLGNWWPSQEPVFSDHLESGDIEVLGTLMTGTTYAPAVPAYVAEEHGVRSLADLDGNRDLFGGEFIGIEAGTPGNEYILDAIGDDAYGLGDWELVESSTAAMLGEVERRADEREPVVFLGWEPHWMNVQWDLVYLEDPEEVWPGAGEIRVLTRAGFESDNPDVARLLSQMEVDTATASAWINRLSKDGDPVETVAQEWIAQNTDEVAAWLDGVETTDGQPAEVPGA